MAAGSRRLAASLVLAVSLLCIGTPVALVGAAATENPLAITAHIGYSDVVKAQAWMPVSIAITNNGPAVEGTLAVEGASSGFGGAPAPAGYERHLVLAAGATKYFHSYLIEEAPGATVTVRVVSRGRVLATQSATPTHSANTLVGVLSSDSSAFDDFAVVHPGQVSPSVVHLGLPDIADTAIGLRPFDVLAIDDFATESLSAAQRGAIADYVHGGGFLLVGTGASWQRTVAGLPADLLPMKIGGLTTLAAAHSLGGLGGVQVATGSLTAGSVWLAEGELPLLVERTVGTGSVTLAAFDWKQEPVSGWVGTKGLLRQVLVRAIYGGQSPQGFAQNFGGPMGGPFGAQGGSILQRSSALSRVLGNLPALDLPSLVLTGSLVLVYVLLVGPVNFFVLRALRRRALAWVTLPLIVLVVAGTVYGAGLLAKGQSVQTNQVSIVHVESGLDRAYEESYTGVLTPTRGDFQVAIENHALYISPLANYMGYSGQPGRGDIRVNGDDGTVTLPGMIAFTLRGFAAEGVVAAPHLSGHLQEANGQLNGSIENHSSTTFTDVVVIAGDGYQKLGTLKPGASIPVSFTPIVNGFGGPPAYMNIYPNYSFRPGGARPTDAEREGEAKTEILALLQGGGNFKGGGTAVITPMVVAWTQQPFETVTVNGGRPHAHAQTAVTMLLPIEQFGAGPLPANVVAGRIVDFEGETRQGPPGSLIVQNGTVTYQFRPRLAPGLRLAGATVVGSNAFFGPGGPVGPGGPASTERGEAWDWSLSSWVDVAYRSGATTNLPAAVVNPATGEVRMRITVAGGAFITGLALGGTVQ